MCNTDHISSYNVKAMYQGGIKKAVLDKSLSHCAALGPLRVHGLKSH